MSLRPRKERRTLVAPLFLITSLLLVAHESESRQDDGSTIRPTAVVETEPVPSEGDAADDPAIWVHPEDPAQSLILGTDKKGGLNVFDLEGKRLQIVSEGSRPNNVDVIHGFPIGGKPVDLAIAGTRTRGKFGMGIWRIDPAKRRLIELAPFPSFPVFGGGEPYGSCVYRSPKDQAFYVFVTNKEGEVEQYRLEPHGESIAARKVRTIQVGSQVEGCVADSELGFLYVGEEDVAIWKYSAEPDSDGSRTLVARVGENGLKDDIEGLALYQGSGSKGYLIASSQGSDSYNIYQRDGSNAYVATIDPRPGAISDVGETDGLDVTNVALPPRFPKGLFVVQDGKPKNGHQNFKLFAWEDIAGNRLLIDTSRPARPRSK